MTTRNTIAEYIKKADYPALVSEANKNQAKVLKYVQSYIYGDYDDPIRWQAISAFGHLAHEYADIYDEPYRNVLRRSLWAMNDESGNVPWSAPEVMAAIIKAAPKYNYDFTAPMLTNGLDNPMCHIGVLWAVGHLGSNFNADLAQFLPRLTFALQSDDALLCGYAIYAFTSCAYKEVEELIKPLCNVNAPLVIYKDEQLQKTTVSALAPNYLREVCAHE